MWLMVEMIWFMVAVMRLTVEIWFMVAVMWLTVEIWFMV